LRQNSLGHLILDDCSKAEFLFIGLTQQLAKLLQSTTPYSTPSQVKSSQVAFNKKQ